MPSPNDLLPILHTYLPTIPDDQIVALAHVLAERGISLNDLVAGDKIGGDKVMRDKTINIYQQYIAPPPAAPPMAPPPRPVAFVERPAEYEQLVALLTKNAQAGHVAITAALRGAGGYGKTTLAAAICQDEAMRAAYPDGRFWVTLGERPEDVRSVVGNLVWRLTGEQPSFATLNEATSALDAALGKRTCLLVVDDVWSAADLHPFLQGGRHCTRLITTRDEGTLPRGTAQVPIDKMQADQALALLSNGLDVVERLRPRLAQLVDRLCAWPLLLTLVNGALVDELNNTTLRKALDRIIQQLDQKGLVAFDATNADERRLAAARTIEVSLDRLGPALRQRHAELAIFPEDIDIPLDAVAQLWNATGDLDADDTEELCIRLKRLSLLLHYDPTTRTIRLHDVVRNYLTHTHESLLPEWHRALIAAYRPTADDGRPTTDDRTADHQGQLWHGEAAQHAAALQTDDRHLAINDRTANRHPFDKLRVSLPTANLSSWADLPANEAYMWQYLGYHLEGGNLIDELTTTVLDAKYLLRKMTQRNVTAAEDDLGRALRFRPDDEVLVLLEQRVRHCGHLLHRCANEHERLGTLIAYLSGLPSLAPILEPLISMMPRPFFMPVIPLTGQHPALLRTLDGHTDRVNSGVFSPDGRAILSASYDVALKLWDARSGRLIRSLDDQTSAVNSGVFSPDGNTILSASNDRTLKLWDAHDGSLIRSFDGHTGGVRSGVFSPDGNTILSASNDRTLKLWDAHDGSLIRSLNGHTSWWNSGVFSPDGRTILSASHDRTLKLWNARFGSLIRSLDGHTDWVTSGVFSPDGHTILSASYDGTLKLWNARFGSLIRSFDGHTKGVMSGVFSPDGHTILSASHDRTLKLWNVRSGSLIRTLNGHTKGVTSGVFSPNGDTILSASADAMLKLWDAASGQCLATFHAESALHWCAFASDGRTVATGGEDRQVYVLRVEG